ncbi:MAG: hypothetical protein IT184_00875 [Acidobacteria bacterium]|nr:hypothetical protein [Acidobacteriota bacterium]
MPVPVIGIPMQTAVKPPLTLVAVFAVADHWNRPHVRASNDAGALSPADDQVVANADEAGAGEGADADAEVWLGDSGLLLRFCTLQPVTAVTSPRRQMDRTAECTRMALPEERMSCRANRSK